MTGLSRSMRSTDPKTKRRVRCVKQCASTDIFNCLHPLPPPPRPSPRQAQVAGSAPPSGAPAGGQWIQEKYCGLATVLVGVFLLPCVCCCPCDDRTVSEAGPRRQAFVCSFFSQCDDSRSRACRMVVKSVLKKNRNKGGKNTCLGASCIIMYSACIISCFSGRTHHSAS